MRITPLLVLIVLAQPLVSGITGADHSWTLLGSRTVSEGADHDTLAVTGERIVVGKLQLRVKGTPVSFQRIVVRYADGEDDRIELSRDAIPAGGESRAIDLSGSDRVIRSVQLWYEAESLDGRPAVVEIYGR